MPFIEVHGDCHDAEWNPMPDVHIVASGMGVISGNSAYSGGDGFFFLLIEVESVYDFWVTAILEGYVFVPPVYSYQSGQPEPNYVEFVGGLAALPPILKSMFGREHVGAGFGQRGQRVG